MQPILTRFKDYLSTPTDGRILGLFRLVYGLFMVYEMTNYISIGLVRNMFVLPRTNFKYDGLEWLVPMSEPAMNFLLYIQVVLALLMAAGIWFKWAARIFAVGYAYIFLIDKSIYNNHIYLFILLALLLSCTHADQFLSLAKKRVARIWRWEQWIIQAQMVMVYFFAGLIKLKYDWLVRQEPMRTGLSNFDSDHLLAPLFRSEFFIQLVSYTGVFLDLLTPLILWYKPVRKWGIWLFIIFHLTNNQIFDDIGIFPFVMLCGLVIFYEVSELGWLRKVLDRWFPLGGPSKNEKQGTIIPLPDPAPTSPILRNILVGYMVFQVLFPIRGYFLPNSMDWTTIGNRFGWRVKADNRDVKDLSFYITDAKGQRLRVEVNTFINTHQMRMLYTDPRCVRELALVIKEDVKKQGIVATSVKASIQFAFNGHPVQYFIDPEVDLLKVTYSPFEKMTWVNDPPVYF